MKITFINGTPGQDDPVNAYLDELTAVLGDRGHSCEVMQLRELDIRYCIGCWGCWVKTPGECSYPDESAEVCRAFIHADWVIFTSPIIMGFTSALLKKTQDKLIPLIHPYFAVVQGEAHHRARYDHYPKIGLLLRREEDTDDSDIEIITDIYHRLSLNFKSALSFAHLTETPVREVADEIDRL
jgi:multimeric flavodoxin WrbA